MSVFVEYKSISVATIQDENIEKCVELRESQSDFFFGQKPDRASSRKWILSHRESTEDVLYQIMHNRTGIFLGTIGFVKRGDEIELGRLAVYARGVYQLLKSEESREEIGQIGLYACIALLRSILGTMSFHSVYAEVLATNALSNKLCREQFGTVQEACKELPNGEKVRMYVYRMTRDEIRNRYGNEKVDVFPA